MNLLRNALTLTAVTLLSLTGAAVGIGSAEATGAADPTPGAPKKLFTISDDRVDESSGLALSSQVRGHLVDGERLR